LFDLIQLPCPTNRLTNENQPVPVAARPQTPWIGIPWGREALEKARQEDRPIIVSIGYSACHWCHVMEREIFREMIRWPGL